MNALEDIWCSMPKRNHY